MFCLKLTQSFTLLTLFATQCMEHTMICLEEQQDEFDFKYQTHKMEGEQRRFWFDCCQ